MPASSPLDDTAMKGPQLQRPLLKVEEYLARVEERPDIQSAMKRKSASEEEVRFYKGSFWPTVDATGNYYLKRPVVFLEDIKWDAAVNVSIPIFDGGTRNAQVREAAAKQSTSDLELAKLRRQAREEIQSFYDSLRVRLAQVAALEKTVGLAEKNYQVLQREFRNGLVRSIDAQVALTEFRVARRTFDQARYSAQIDLIGLEASAFMVPLVSEKGIKP
jgi:outer membrane protein